MNQWPETYRDPWLPPAERGRVGTRLVRGLLWSVLLLVVILALLALYQYVTLPSLSDCPICI